MKLMNTLKKVEKRFRRDGVRETTELIWKNLVFSGRAHIHRKFDEKYGIDTSLRIELDELSVTGQNKKFGIYYEATPEKTLKAILAHLPKNLSEFVLIDFGCGKGRIIAVASNLDFKSLIGVEFTRELHEIAVRNFRNFKHINQKCSQIEIVHGDAATFNLPAEKSVYYFFAPFRHPVFAEVLENIKSSYRLYPRKVYLQYYNPNPVVIEMLDGIEFMQKMKTRPLSYDFSAPIQRKFVMYESKDEK